MKACRSTDGNRPRRTPVAELAPNVLGNVLSCDGEWCELSVDDYSGFVQQDQLWGVYKDEVIK